MKRAVLRGWPQEMTAHFIDSFIDAGSVLLKQRIRIYEDDTLMDMELRLLGVAMDVIPQAIAQAVAHPIAFWPRLERGSYNAILTPDEDRLVMERLPEYCRKFSRT